MTSNSNYKRATPVKGSPLKSPRKDPIVDDQVIQEFCTIIENTPSDEWLKRSSALEALVNSIPPDPAAHSSQWFNSAKTLRYLALPVSSLLKDARSTVIKRTCESMTLLFAKCGGEARYLLKDLMITIIGVHAQTVQVIRTYVQAMVIDALQKVPCKAAMPLWLEKLKTDKRKTVREACALYLTTGLECWQDDPTYLSHDIWMQVGTLLIRTLRDPSPSVRDIVKQGLEMIRSSQPEIWQKLVHDPDCPAARDAKLQKYLLNLGSEIELTDDVSVASIRSMASNASKGSSRATPSNASTTQNQQQHKAKRGGLGPPMRVTPLPFVAVIESPPGKSANRQSPSQRPLSPKSMFPNGTYLPPRSRDFTFEDEGPFIAGVEALKKKAKRRSRRSSLMQERWRTSITLESKSPNSSVRKSNTSLVDVEVTVPVTYQGTADSRPNEHLSLAITLLEAHREHVDKIMETLRLEMDTLKEFEELLMSQDPSKPSEEDVLDYFESVGLCLDQRTASGNELQIAMDRISQGAD